MELESAPSGDFSPIAFNPNTRPGFLELNGGTFNKLGSFTY